ncbi:hypothetical protein BX666DRAFT_1850415, partial [Dichotomocladium elegans]
VVQKLLLIPTVRINNVESTTAKVSKILHDGPSNLHFICGNFLCGKEKMCQKKSSRPCHRFRHDNVALLDSGYSYRCPCAKCLLPRNTCIVFQNRSKGRIDAGLQCQKAHICFSSRL